MKIPTYLFIFKVMNYLKSPAILIEIIFKLIMIYIYISQCAKNHYCTK